jgi:hypothetical protein
MYIRNNIIRIRVSFICKLSGISDQGATTPRSPFSLPCPQLNSLNPPSEKNSWVCHWSQPGTSSLVPHVGFVPLASITAVAVGFGHTSLVKLHLHLWIEVDIQLSKWLLLALTSITRSAAWSKREGEVVIDCVTRISLWHVGTTGRPIIWHPKKLLFFQLLWPKTGLAHAKTVDDLCRNSFTYGTCIY